MLAFLVRNEKAGEREIEGETERAELEGLLGEGEREVTDEIRRLMVRRRKISKLAAIGSVAHDAS